MGRIFAGFAVAVALIVSPASGMWGTVHFDRSTRHNALKPSGVSTDVRCYPLAAWFDDQCAAWAEIQLYEDEPKARTAMGCETVLVTGPRVPGALGLIIRSDVERMDCNDREGVRHELVRSVGKELDLPYAGRSHSDARRDARGESVWRPATTRG